MRSRVPRIFAIAVNLKLASPANETRSANIVYSGWVKTIVSLFPLFALVLNGALSHAGPILHRISKTQAEHAVETLHWQAPEPGSTDTLGTLVTSRAGGASFGLLTAKITSGSGPLTCIGSSWDLKGTRLVISYKTGAETVQVEMGFETNGTTFTADLDAHQPIITSAAFEKWSPALATYSIPVPYYTGQIYFSNTLSSYLNAWWDWHTTAATSLDERSVQYLLRTDGTRNMLHERIVAVVSPDVDDVLPAPLSPPSPFMSLLAGRTVLDIWDGGFNAIRQGLAQLEDYGVGNCVAIIHNWQFAGYDNGLPQHYPANPALGGESALKAAIAQGKANGCLVALHENYIDYYPDFPGFKAASVALNSDGSFMPAWLHKTHAPVGSSPSATAEMLSHGWKPLTSMPGWMAIQSFSAKPSWMLRNASTQSPLIHKDYGTTAAYLDVNSAAPISSHGDMDASAPGSGMLRTWMAASQSLWAYLRQTHNGPVLGEGARHWYYSGMLDGVEAQLGAGAIPQNIDAALPLFVDFDLLRIHPLQVNHGMGYYSRWMHLPATSMTPLQLDAYRMQEIAFGHAPFVSDWREIPLTFVESNLVSPVAKIYGTARVTTISYGAGDKWISPSEAARSGQFSQVQVEYDNGLTVVANSASAPLTWRGFNIPQYGWAAEGDGLIAYTALCGTAICDFAQTPTSIFANARDQQDQSPSVRSDFAVSRVNLKDTVVNFGVVQTDGMLSITQSDNGNWTLRPVPNDRSFTVLLDAHTLPMPKTVSATGPSGTAVILPIARGRYWELPLNGSHSYSWPSVKRRSADKHR